LAYEGEDFEIMM